ncbi:MAG: hypothetical protein KDA83_03575 [Planctomycetales bacterium]|nr:hypothetical protein [Planctomycetales bacterium]
MVTLLLVGFVGLGVVVLGCAGIIGAVIYVGSQEVEIASSDIDTGSSVFGSTGFDDSGSDRQAGAQNSMTIELPEIPRLTEPPRQNYSDVPEDLYIPWSYPAGPRLPGRDMIITREFKSSVPYWTEIDTRYVEPGRNAAPDYIRVLSVVDPDLADCLTALPNPDRSKLNVTAKRNRDMIAAWFEARRTGVGSLPTAEQLRSFDVLFERLGAVQERKTDCDFQLVEDRISTQAHVSAAITLQMLLILRGEFLGDQLPIVQMIDEYSITLRYLRDCNWGGYQTAVQLLNCELNLHEFYVPKLWCGRSTTAELRLLKDIVMAHDKAHDIKRFNEHLYVETWNFRFLLEHARDGDPEGIARSLLLSGENMSDPRTLPRTELVLRTFAQYGDDEVREAAMLFDGVTHAATFSREAKWEESTLVVQRDFYVGLRQATDDLIVSGAITAETAPEAAILAYVDNLDELHAIYMKAFAFRRIVYIQSHIFANYKSSGNLPERVQETVMGLNDPYTSQPFLLATVNGHPVVYSVGPNLKDEGAWSKAEGPWGESGDLFLEDTSRPFPWPEP